MNYLRIGGSCTRAVRGAILQVPSQVAACSDIWICSWTGRLWISPDAPLQAPVSDREYRATLPETAAMLDLAESMIKTGKANDLMPREASPEAPITAYRSETQTVCGRKEGGELSP